MPRITAIFNIVSAARIWKNLPLLFIFLSGTVVGDVPDNPVLMGIAIGTIAMASAFMTHLNIITDRDLDLIRKPHLYRMLSSDRSVMRGALVLEFLVPLAGISVLAGMGRWQTALALLSFFIVSILYSYNFFSPSPQKHRFKVFWTGHFFALITGYLSLWFAGYCLSGTDNPLRWLPAFLGISLSEYALFLFESSVDQSEEETQRLKTLASLLGTRKSTWVSIAVACLALAILLSDIAWGGHDTVGQHMLRFAFLPPAVFILVFLGIAMRKYHKKEIFKIPDIIFNLGRIYILLSCIYIKYMV